MIYIINKENNTITTDSWVEYIPATIVVHLNNDFIGEYNNESIVNEYMVFTIPKEDIVNIENQEYKMKLLNGDNMTMIKIELVVVKSNVTSESNSVVNNKTNKFYN